MRKACTEIKRKDIGDPKHISQAYKLDAQRWLVKHTYDMLWCLYYVTNGFIRRDRIPHARTGGLISAYRKRSKSYREKMAALIVPVTEPILSTELNLV